MSVYNGDPRLSYPLVATVSTTSIIASGGFEDVEIRINSNVAAEQTLHFVADDAGDLTGTVSECDEDNNIHDSGLYLNRIPEVDVGPDQVISFSEPSTVVSATVSDDGLPVPRTVQKVNRP